MPLETPVDAGIAQVARQLLAGTQPVEVLALTPDADLLAILREATGREQRIWHAATREQAAELIMSGQVGVMVIDTLTTGEDCAVFCDQLRAQFPDLVLVVAGTAADQSELVKYITSGDVYRFLHKPVSPPRARHAIDAAIRHFIEGRTIAAAEAEPGEPRSHLALISGVGAAVVLVAAVTTALLLRSGGEATAPGGALRQAASVPMDTAPATAEADAERSAWLASAVAATEAGRLTAADGSAAADYYQRVLAKYPEDRAAAEGLDRIADQLLSSAENALLEQRLDEAARDIDAARTVRPNNMRLAFLSAQLAKERERGLISRAREAAATGDYARSRTLLERAAELQTTQSPALQLARRELEQHQLGSNVEALLRSAGERLQQGRLVEPEGDSAKSFVQAALAADPANVAAQQLRRAVGDQTLQRSRQALAQRDLAAAESWMRHAASLGANVRATQRELQAARQVQARAEQQTRLVALLNERIAQSQLLSPAEDSARHYWLQLREADPANDHLQPTLQTLGTGLTQQAQVEFLARRYQSARDTIAAAQSLGYTSSELSQIESRVAEQLEREAFRANVVPAGSLAQDRYVEARYPTVAERRGLGGWVEMDFTVAVDGSVKDIEIRGAEPVGVFEQAAVRAVSQWRYRPVLRNGRAVEQRARLRMRFEVEE